MKIYGTAYAMHGMTSHWTSSMASAPSASAASAGVTSRSNSYSCMSSIRLCDDTMGGCKQSLSPVTECALHPEQWHLGSRVADKDAIPRSEAFLGMHMP